MENKVIAIVQARLTSTRYPAKILEKIGKITILEFLIKRLKKSKSIDKIIIAIPKDKKNFLIKKHIKKTEIFEGSENNVLDRFYKTALKYKGKIIVRICGDCPFIDPKLIDKLVNKIKHDKIDYISNTINPTYPDGLDVEVLTFNTLKKTWLKAKSKDDKEHVTRFIIKNKNFKKINYKFRKDLSNIRLTIDEKIDLEQLRSIYFHLKRKENFGIEEIYQLYKKRKRLFDMNKNIKRNEGGSLNKGQKIWRRAKSIIPGGNMLLSKRPEMYAPDQWPSYYKKAKGCNVWDMENKKYLDMSLMSVGTNILGYSNSLIDSAVIKSIKKSNMSSLNCYEEIELGEKLLSMHKGLDMIRYARTGGEANAIAVRIARAASGKDKIAICGYHGWHDWYLSANLNYNNSSQGVLKDHLLPGLSTKGVPKNLKNTIFPFNFNDFDGLEKICNSHNIGVIKMEIFRNIPPKNNFLEKVKNLAQKKGIVLIFDECTSGFRETFGGLHLKYNVKPDICILGKALGNGFPITAVLGKKSIMENAQSTFISSTFWTERSGYVAGLKTLEIMEKTKSWKIITEQGKKIKEMLKRISKSNKIDIKISGLDACPSYLISSDNWLGYKTLITQELLKKKILGGNTTYLSISHTDKILKKYELELSKIFGQISKIMKSGNKIENYLDGPVCHSSFKRLN